MTKVSVVRNTEPYMNLRIVHFAKTETAEIFANEQKRVTVNLTKSGFGADGKPMIPLTRKYAAFKRRGTGKAIRDMRLYGDLMKSLKVTKERGTEGAFSARLGFGADQEKKVQGNQAHAEFFGIHPTALRFGEVEAVKQFNALR